MKPVDTNKRLISMGTPPFKKKNPVKTQIKRKLSLNVSRLGRVLPWTSSMPVSVTNTNRSAGVVKQLQLPERTDLMKTANLMKPGESSSFSLETETQTACPPIITRMTALLLDTGSLWPFSLQMPGTQARSLSEMSRLPLRRSSLRRRLALITRCLPGFSLLWTV